ncbi:MAG: ferritin [Spirosomataceae bacterium]|jgi:ferritin
MKNLTRMRTSLTEEVQDILNAQVEMEGNASQKYLAMATWCDRNGYKNSAIYFYSQSEEERSHMLKIIKFVIDMGGSVTTPDVQQPKQEYTSVRECFETSLESEIMVTKSINRIVAASREANDFATEQLALWFVKEQIEEEYLARRAIEMIDLMEGESLFVIDTELGNIRDQAPTAFDAAEAE